MTSGTGSGVVPPNPWPSWTRRYCPGASVTAGSSVIWFALAPRFPVPVDEAYWIDQPASDALVEPRLNSSTKSWVYVAPALPPPP
jgi:hypothetical protein